MERATEKSSKIQSDECRKLRESCVSAFQKLSRSLKCRPAPRWFMDGVYDGTIAPDKRAMEYMEQCAKAGATLEDLTAYGYALVGYAERLNAIYANQESPVDVRAVLNADAHADAPQDEAAADVMCDPSNTAAYERLHETTAATIRSGYEVLRICRSMLSMVGAAR